MRLLVKTSDMILNPMFSLKDPSLLAFDERRGVDQNLKDIYLWNYLYLSQKLARIETGEAKNLLLTTISTHSVVSWAHINLLGEYDFSDEKLQDSVGILPPKLAA